MKEESGIDAGGVLLEVDKIELKNVTDFEKIKELNKEIMVILDRVKLRKKLIKKMMQ